MSCCRILATPPPDREHRGQEFGAAAFDLFEKSRGERTLLRVFTARVELARNKAAGEVFGDGQAVASDGHERGAVQRHHAGLAEQAHPRRALGQYRRKCIGPQCNPICVVEEQGGLGFDQFGRKPLVEFFPLAAHGERTRAYAERDGADRADEQALAAACSRHGRCGHEHSRRKP